MITRRDFGLLGAGAGLSLLGVSEADAQGVNTVRLGNAAGIVDAQVIFFTVGQHKRVGHFAEERVAMDIINMSGSGQTLQAVATGNCETSAVSPPAYLGVYAKNPTLDVFSVYCWLRQTHWAVGVKPDSPIKSLAELKGKKVGIRNQGDTGYIGTRAMLKEIGIDPDKDLEFIPVGEGGPAGEAVYKGRVDAMAFWDGAFARIDLAGFPLRLLPNTPGMQKLFGQTFTARRSDFAKNKDVYTRFFRAMAKSTVFAYANPEVSIKLHWELFPESKAKGKSDEEAMKDALKIVNSRKDKWMPAPWQTDKRFGAMSKEEWEAQLVFAGVQDQIKDVGPVFTTELIDEVNKFDVKAIEEQARNFKL